MASKLDIPLYGSSLKIVERCGSALSDVLHSKFGCVANIDGVDFEEHPSIAQQRRPTVVPEKRFVVTLPSGVQVSVWKADLTNFHVDAVVNAANDCLQHYGGLALALSTTGGPKIQKESDDHIAMYGKLKTGDAIVSDSWALPCKKIIHAVGPSLFKYPTVADVAQAEPKLQTAIRSILDRVKENQLKTVAIPAISSGLFNYPLLKCADTIVRTVERYYEKTSGHLPKEIMLVNHDEPTVKEMERACRHILAPHTPMTYSQAAASRSKGDTRTSTSTVQIGNVHLTLKRGRIEDQQTDVIVNTTYDRNLSAGEISQAILHKAGSEMQREMKTAAQHGHVIITKPYRLQCKEVYHTLCTCRGTDSGQLAAAAQILYHSVLNCLMLAAGNGHKSIAFPAIGTGGLGFNKEEAAQTMSCAVHNFALTDPKKTEVYFVIFPSDKKTFEAFEGQMRYLQQKASHSSSAHEFVPRDDFAGSSAPTPQISLSGPSDAAAREADHWLHGLLSKTSGPVIIYNNFIQHFGMQEHQQLSRLMEKGVSIEELFDRGRARIVVQGDSVVDVVVAALQVEAILCNIQKEFVREEECATPQMLAQNVSFERKEVDSSSRQVEFKHMGLQIVKVDKVENATLEMIFGLKKNQLRCSSPQKMFQRIPAHFCEMVSHIGFHAEYAPPDDPAYGEGIYFTSTVKKAMEVWKEPNAEYLHFVEAEVLTGNSVPGKPGLILPPAVGTDPHILYDSVSGGGEISVIFSGYQALPKYIITCKICKY